MLGPSHHRVWCCRVWPGSSLLHTSSHRSWVEGWSRSECVWSDRHHSAYHSGTRDSSETNLHPLQHKHKREYKHRHEYNTSIFACFILLYTYKSLLHTVRLRPNGLFQFNHSVIFWPSFFLFWLWWTMYSPKCLQQLTWWIVYYCRLGLKLSTRVVKNCNYPFIYF